MWRAKVVRVLGAAEVALLELGERVRVVVVALCGGLEVFFDPLTRSVLRLLCAVHE